MSGRRELLRDASFFNMLFGHSAVPIRAFTAQHQETQNAHRIRSKGDHEICSIQNVIHDHEDVQKI